MDIKKLWETEKKVIKKCELELTYDDILQNTLNRLCYEIDAAIIDGFDCTDSLAQIIEVLNNQRYIREILSKAPETQKELVKDLLNTLYMLDTSIKYSKPGVKEKIITNNAYMRKENIKLPNSKGSVDTYKDLWKPSEDNRNLNEYKKLNKKY